MDYELVSKRFAKLPHDDWYDDYTWTYILGSPDDGIGHNYNHGYPGVDKFDPTQIKNVDLWAVDEGSYGPEHSAVGLFEMEDGTWVVYEGGCDTTGWGCQDSARFTFHTTRMDALKFGLDDYSRKQFNIDLFDGEEESNAEHGGTNSGV
jgi:hypothetical protein